MIGVGETLPDFKVVGVKPNFNRHEENGESAFEAVTKDSFPGKWKVIFFRGVQQGSLSVGLTQSTGLALRKDLCRTRGQNILPRCRLRKNSLNNLRVKISVQSGANSFGVCLFSYSSLNFVPS